MEKRGGPDSGRQMDGKVALEEHRTSADACTGSRTGMCWLHFSRARVNGAAWSLVQTRLPRI